MPLSLVPAISRLRNGEQGLCRPGTGRAPARRPESPGEVAVSPAKHPCFFPPAVSRVARDTGPPAVWGARSGTRVGCPRGASRNPPGTPCALIAGYHGGESSTWYPSCISPNFWGEKGKIKFWYKISSRYFFCASGGHVSRQPRKALLIGHTKASKHIIKNINLFN